MRKLLPFHSLVLTVCLVVGSYILSIAQTIQVVSSLQNTTILVDSKSPNAFTSSNLPIVLIDTHGKTIIDEPKIPVGLKIINNKPGIRNTITDTPEFDGYAGIEIRGSSSQMFPKKSYGFESWDAQGNDIDTSFLGMPSESDWILNASYTDKSFLRNVLAYQVWQNMGHYGSRYHFVELLINGEYKGLYIFSEKIKRNTNRVNIAKLKTTQNSGDELTGGYIIKIDKQTGTITPGWTSSYKPLANPNGQTIYFQYEYPKAEDITSQQKIYMQNYVYSFETALKSSSFADTNTGYRKYAVENTFIDYFLVNEISKNVDGYRISTFFNKERESKGGKLRMGPVWDYDIAWHNANYCEGDITTGWAYQFPCVTDYWQPPFWWSRMLEDPLYKNHLKCRWLSLRKSTLSNAWFDKYIDSISGQLLESQKRNFDTWPILGTYIWPNPWPYASTHQDEVLNLKNWIHNRLSWMDANMPGTCEVPFGIETFEVKTVFAIYPNPVSDKVFISFKNDKRSNIEITLINPQGIVLVKTEKVSVPIGEWSESVDLSSFNPGVYLILITLDGKSSSKRLLKI